MTANDPLQGVAYEFSEEQNQVIGRLGRYMRILGIFAIGVGALACIVGLFAIRSGGGLAAIVQGAVSVAIGALTRGAGLEFEGIVATQGNDIGHLMNALRSLLKIYQIHIWLLIAAFVAIFAMFAFLLGSHSV